MLFALVFHHARQLSNIYRINLSNIKGGYLDFSHLTQLKDMYDISEIYIKKQYKSSITKNHKI